MVKEKKKGFRCGVVSIVGRPNVGKSTLLNKIVGEKVAIVSPVPQTTRHKVRGIYTDERGQIIFIDTPGLQMGKDHLGKMMNQSSLASLGDVDCVLYLVDTTRRVGKEEEFLGKQIAAMKVPVILGLNKVDMKDIDIDSYVAHWERMKDKEINKIKSFTMVALSGKEGLNVEKLLDIIFDYLPVGEALYPKDVITDTPQKLVISDIIREKFFMLMRDEIPHSLGVHIEEVSRKRPDVLYVKALVYIERDSQKEIVIGKKGNILKSVGTQARKELEDILETKIFLDLHVKIEHNWRDDPSILRDLGYGGEG